MKNIYLGTALALGLFGCAYNGLSDMTNEDYKYYSDVMAYSEKCFDLERISPELASNTIHNFKVVVSLLNFDKNKLYQMRNDTKKRLASNENINCRTAELEMRNVIAHGERIQRNQAAQAGRPVSNSITNQNNNLKACKKIGDLSGRIYSFTGFCPVGYY